ncbi:hypothetical protein [Cochleicola gelatinilyticus]|uniref:Lysine transporter LysE n=1 Tax=Cochleicola gelatinilyticus TaxID=1763537 RepID=A0A167KCR1_9FLAO|nr:hypothetical protein [Cochleicola gelatinilyticus]OAB81735.1 hypothetical protein ULVI_00700 [Cochleicola gelatinilyticus]
MTLFLFLLLGLLISGLGTIPVGGSNIAVIKTSKEESVGRAIPIAIGASLGETILAFLSLWYSNAIVDFFETNLWVQILFLALFFIVGLLFLFPKLVQIDFEVDTKGKSVRANFLTGLSFGIINPTVLLYYIIAVSLAQEYLLYISEVSSKIVLAFFFCGVFAGKVLVLYLYGKLSKTYEDKKPKNKNNIYRWIGLAIVLISIAQGIRMLLE